MSFWDWFWPFNRTPPQRCDHTPPEQLRAEARKLVAQSRFEEAVEVYTKIYKSDRTPLVLVEYAHVYLALNNEYWPMFFALQVRGQAGGAAAALCIEGMIAWRQGKQAEGRAKFDEARRLGPDFSWARRDLDSLFPPP